MNSSSGSTARIDRESGGRGEDWDWGVVWPLVVSGGVWRARLEGREVSGSVLESPEGEREAREVIVCCRVTMRGAGATAFE